MARKLALVFSLFCGLEDLDFETLHLFRSFKVTKLDYFEIIIKKSKVNINRANVKNVLNRLLSSSWIFFSFLLSLVKLSLFRTCGKSWTSIFSVCSFPRMLDRVGIEAAVWYGGESISWRYGFKPDWFERTLKINWKTTDQKLYYTIHIHGRTLKIIIIIHSVFTVSLNQALHSYLLVLGTRLRFRWLRFRLRE